MVNEDMSKDGQGHSPAVTGDDGDGLKEGEAADATTLERVLVRGKPTRLLGFGSSYRSHAILRPVNSDSHDREEGYRFPFPHQGYLPSIVSQDNKKIRTREAIENFDK